MKTTRSMRSLLAALFATALVTNAQHYNCDSVRTDLATSYLSEINYPAGIPNSERQVAARSFSQAWKKLAKERNGKKATCEETIKPKAVTDLVKVCDRAGLNLDGCTKMLDTLVSLISQNEGEEESTGVIIKPCRCAGSIKSVTAKDRLSDNSCQDINNPIIQKWMEFPGHPTGSFASFDDKEGFCADGDAINIISREEGIACVEQIADACEKLGRKIPNRDELQP
mmetsp:Transcript_9140/g.11617  ORF Transcript_9140/g.11617 Transcript_9140/m.11617 type:complete len:226 (+) Transcript_9140:44-721(+)